MMTQQSIHTVDKLNKDTLQVNTIEQQTNERTRTRTKNQIASKCCLSQRKGVNRNSGMIVNDTKEERI